VNPETLERFETRFAKYGFRRESANFRYMAFAEAALAVTFPPLNRGPACGYHRFATFSPPRAVLYPAAPGPAAIAFVSSGSAVPNHEVRVVDDSADEVPDRTEGFLWFRGPSATSGYYNNPAATEKLFSRGSVSRR